MRFQPKLKSYYVITLFSASEGNHSLLEISAVPSPQAQISSPGYFYHHTPSAGLTACTPALVAVVEQ